jgi:hypothetical protein
MRRFLAVPVLLLLLVGCAVPAPSATPSVSLGATATPTPTSTPAPAPAPAPATPATPATPVYTENTADWIITYTGIGPIEFRQPFSQIAATIPSPDRLIEACPPLSLYTSGIQPQVGVAYVDDIPWDLVVTTFGQEPLTDQAPHTEAGIRVGSTEADILAAYPDAELRGDATYGAYVITDGAGGYITFDMDEGLVYGIHVSDHPSSPKEYCA